jgi:hypothetical protein
VVEVSAGLAIVTSAAFPFRARARVMIRSLREFHPAAEIFSLAVANGDPRAEWFAGATPVTLGELGIPDLAGFRFRYTCREVAIATKPFLLAHALDRGFAGALFLDADLWILDSLEGLFRQVLAHPLTLSPHRLRPAATAADELRLLRAGTFNGGVVGVGAGGSRRFLDWWCRRVHADCRMAPEAGLHDDQRWLDLAPGFVEGFAVVGDPGVNVAYWNLDERPLGIRNGVWSAGDALLRLFHFSGFDPDKPARMSVHADAELPPDGAPLFAAYADAVAAETLAGAAAAGSSNDADGGDERDDGDCRAIEYLSSHFANGVPIPAVARSLYAQVPPGKTFADPTACGDHSYFEWLLAPVIGDDSLPGGSREPGRRCRPVPRLWLEIHRRRPDLQRAFAAPCGSDRERFGDWVRTHGRSEYGLDRAFLLDDGS